MAHSTYPSPRQARGIARGLGWFSIALGLVELVAARRLARAVGLPGHAALVAANGARELATGIALLRCDRPAPYLWARLAGDVMDAAALGTGLRGNNPGRAVVALAAVTGVAVVDLACARSLSRVQPRLALDYSSRSGWPLPAAEMRGAALEDFEAPRDMRIPEALRPWIRGQGSAAFRG